MLSRRSQAQRTMYRVSTIILSVYNGVNPKDTEGGLVVTGVGKMETNYISVRFLLGMMEMYYKFR